MSRTTSRVLSATVCAVTVGALTALGGPAAAVAGPGVCRTTLTGGIVGDAVVASSSQVLGVAVPESQSVSIDAVTVVPSGELRYRLAAPILVLDVRAMDSAPLRAGAGYYVETSKLDRNKRFLSCVDKRLRPPS